MLVICFTLLEIILELMNSDFPIMKYSSLLNKEAFIKKFLLSILLMIMILEAIMQMD
jgi:hypothetical protein